MNVTLTLECPTLFGKDIAALKYRQAALEESRQAGKPTTALNSRKSSLQQRPRQFVSMTAPRNPTEVIVC